MAVDISLDAAVVFRRFIQNNVQYALSRLSPGDNAVPEPEDRQWMLQALDYALEYPDAWPATRELVVALAPRMEQVGYREEWLGYLSRGIERSTEHSDEATEAELRLQLGILHQLLAQYDDARREMGISVQQFQKVGDERGRARASNRLAYVLRRQGKREQAATMAGDALGLLDDDDPERGYCHLVFGAIKLDERQWEDAAAHFQSALAIWRQAPNPRLLGWGHVNLAQALRRLQQFDAAERHLAQAIQLFRQITDPVNEGIAQMTWGNILLGRDQFEQALVRYHKARFIFHRTQDLTSLGILELNIGLARRHLEQFAQAEAAYQAGICTLQTLPNKTSLVNAMGGLAQVYLDQKRYDDAIAILHKAIALLPSIVEPHSRQFFSKVLTELLEEAEQGKV